MNLSDSQLNALFATVSGYLEYQHRLLERLRAADFPAEDPLYRDCRQSVLAMRELYLVVNDGRRKGVSHRAQKRAKAWPPV